MGVKKAISLMVGKNIKDLNELSDFVNDSEDAETVGGFLVHAIDRITTHGEYMHINESTPLKESYNCLLKKFPQIRYIQSEYKSPQ